MNEKGPKWQIMILAASNLVVALVDPKKMIFDEELGASSEVLCAKCGTSVGTVEDLRSSALSAAKSAMPNIAAALKKAFKL